jgi:hypothetical protein
MGVTTTRTSWAFLIYMTVIQTIDELRLWLAKPCHESEVRYLDEEKKEGAYIPIGIIEEKLDTFNEWGTDDFVFSLDRTGNVWFASGSLVLYVAFHEGIDGESLTFKKKVSGAVTFPISSKDENMDFAGTVLSLCIANASKKLGKQFGRHLNGRLDKGEHMPTIDMAFEKERDLALDDLLKAENQEQLKEVYAKHDRFHKDRQFLDHASAISKQFLAKKKKEVTNEQ